MSWLRHDEPSLVLQEGDPLQSLDSLATLLKETEAALAQERAQHAASKAALAECKLSEREAQSLVSRLRAVHESEIVDALFIDVLLRF